MRPPADPYETGPLEIDPLGAVLAGMLRTRGVQAARAVDGRLGLVVAAVGATGGDDVAALVQLARATAPVAPRGDGLDDVVVTTRRSVHVLRECGVPGTFLHLRLDRERGDVGAARRALRAAGLQRAVRAWLDGPPVQPAAPLAPAVFHAAAFQVGASQPVASEPTTAQPVPAEQGPAQPAMVEPVPAPGMPVSPAPRPTAAPTSGPASVPSLIPRPRHPTVPAFDQQPALVTLAGVRPQASAGALAVLALQDVDPRADADLPLPRRKPSPRPMAVGPAGDAVLKQAWARDMDALHRVLAGLRRLP